ncbi:hypothetical protein GP486_007739 [Trichoglossum hirsutum]|uniref:Uncharacterized protein n=1 Tax=Trichoglossum hirsutum TaxID=265104 RepID=A0A9P8IB97_9PEZI|nr:hypothetical protein GP486_007739 [Trichoglossum hirsutum]
MAMASSNLFSNYGASNNQSYAPSHQGSLDNFPGQEALPFISPPQSQHLTQYTAQQPATGHENTLPYGGGLNSDQRADVFQTPSNVFDGSQYLDLNLVPRLDQNPPPATSGMHPLPMSEGIADSIRIPYSPEGEPQAEFHTRVADASENRIPDGDDADIGYASRPDLTGLTAPDSVTNVAYSPQIEDDQLAPLPVTEQIPHYPTRQAPSKPSRSDGPMTTQRGPLKTNANSYNVSRRARKGLKNTRKVARLLTRIKERVVKKTKFNTPESKEQYTKNRRIGNCLLCKRGACKRASWPGILVTPSVFFVVGPLESPRISPVTVKEDPQNGIVFDIGQLKGFIDQLGISLNIDQSLNDQEASILDCSECVPHN